MAEYYFTHHQDFTAPSMPSVEVVLTSLPEEVIHRACAVRCEYSQYEPSLQRHLYKVTIYDGELPKKIAEQPVILNGRYHYPVHLMTFNVDRKLRLEKPVAVRRQKRRLGL
jgi:hypothetical protein